MAGEIVLAGGEEFRTGCEEMDSFILQASGIDPPRVLILPTAAVDGPEIAASNGVRYFSRLGALASELMVLNQKQADDEELIKGVSGTSLIYFTGGSPEHLLYTLEGSKLLDRLLVERSKGALIGGSSAGAMVMGSMMWLRSARAWVHGLGIAEGIAVLPHHERGDPVTVSDWLASTSAPTELKVLGIDARTSCIGTSGNWNVLGSGQVTVYHDGSWTIFSAGESLPPAI